MQISYKPLWHTLLERGMSKEDLRIKAKLTTNAIANMGKDQNISMSTLLKICETLQCDLDSVVEIQGFKFQMYHNQETNEQIKDENKMHSNNPPRLVSLFSGCGGMDKGFENAGYKRVWANDFDKDAQAVFRINLGEIDGRDITKVPVEDIPNCDIITAGFPCQPFSNAGNRRGVYDERGELYLECLRIIKSKNPRAVLFENVRGLLSSKHQSGEKLIDVIKKDLENLGYQVNYEVVNASDYGVPQNRHRLILVALRNDIGKVFDFPPVQEDKRKLTLRHILNVSPELQNQSFWPYSPQAQSMIEQIPEGGSWKNIPYENLSPRFRKIRDDMKRYHAPNFYRRFSMDEINGTITASAQPENCGITHPTENRRYTLREIARIQTFPDDFVFIDDTPKNVVAMYKVIGNAVPVKLAEIIANAIYDQAFSDKEDN
jgi:DNA (cytosine-5)-methyltransferase 1